MNTTTLNFATDSFDQDNTFVIECQGYKRTKLITAKLKRGYKTRDDGVVWAMQRGACLKDVYTAKDREESDRLRDMQPVRHGDLVLIGGQQFKARVLGDFSDCAIFDPA